MMEQGDANSTTTEPAGDWLSPRRALVLLLVILVVATVVRLRGISAPPMLDELWSLELSTGRGSVQLKLPVNDLFPAPAMTELKDAPPAWAVWTSLDRVSHPPLYFLMLRGWRAVFGDGDVAARCLSLAASLAAIVLLYDSVRLLAQSRAVALWSAALLAIAEPQITQGHLVRGYTLLLMLGTLAWWIGARMREMPPVARPTRTTFAYCGALCAVTLAMLLTHYFAAGAVVAMVLFSLLSLRGAARRYAFFAMFAAGCFFMALWGPRLADHVRQFSGRDSTTEFLQRTTVGWPRLVETSADLGAAPLRLLVDLDVRTIPWFWLAGVGCVVMMLAAIRRGRAGMLMATLWLLGTIGFVAGLDLARSTTQLREVRYLLLASPGLYVLLAISAGGAVAGLSRKQVLLKQAIPAVLVLACIARAAGPQSPPEADWRPIAAYLDDPTRAKQAIVFSPPRPDWFLGHLVMAYRHASTQPPGREMVVLQPEAPERIVSRLARDGGAFAICEAKQAPGIERMLPGWSVTPVDIAGVPRLVWELRPPGTF